MVLSPSELLAKSQVIAIVGMSTQPEKVAHTVPLQLLRHGWTVIPVNPRAESIAGQKAYRQLADVPVAIDLVNVFRPSDGTWYRQNSSNGQFIATPFGTNADKPTMTAFRY